MACISSVQEARILQGATEFSQKGTEFGPAAKEGFEAELLTILIPIMVKWGINCKLNNVNDKDYVLIHTRWGGGGVYERYTSETKEPWVIQR